MNAEDRARITVYLDLNDLERLKAWAKTEKRSVSNLASIIINQHLNLESVKISNGEEKTISSYQALQEQAEKLSDHYRYRG